MNVFPEEMNRIDTSDPAAALRQLENYIRYICERVEFSSNSLVKTVSTSMTTAEVVQRLRDLETQVSSAISTVGGYSARITELETKVRNIQDVDFPELNQRISGLNSTLVAFEERLVMAEQKVRTLEPYLPAADEGAPGTTTEGTPGQIYRDVLTGKIYICIAVGEIDGEPVYYWKEITLTEP